MALKCRERSVPPVVCKISSTFWKLWSYHPNFGNDLQVRDRQDEPPSPDRLDDSTTRYLRILDINIDRPHPQPPTSSSSSRPYFNSYNLAQVAMPDLSLLATPSPYHILAYGTLLGTQVFQSFVNGIVAYRSLPRPHFSALQQAIFPIYFALQTALPAVLAVTYPGGRSGGPGSVAGVLAAGNTWSTMTPLGLMLATAGTNLLVVGPATTKIMLERKAQETRDGKKSYDPAPHSKEMQLLSKRFGKMHGASSLLNMVGLLATIWYGLTLAERIH